MVDPTLVDELVLRTGVSRAAAEAVLAALAQIAAERTPGAAAADPAPLAERWPAPPRYVPDPDEVDALIAAAERHPLGLEFLLHGDLSAVAITFQVHAFAVDAARRQLTGRGV